LAAVREHPDCAIVLAVTPDAYGGRGGLPCWLQGPGDLGERIERLAERALLLVPWVLFLGTDSPGLPYALREKLITHLSAAGEDAVLGPTDDGGFYALGLRKPVSLKGVQWSSAQTCIDTERSSEAG